NDDKPNRDLRSSLRPHVDWRGYVPGEKAQAAGANPAGHNIRNAPLPAHARTSAGPRSLAHGRAKLPFGFQAQSGNNVSQLDEAFILVHFLFSKLPLIGFASEKIQPRLGGLAELQVAQRLHAFRVE